MKTHVQLTEHATRPNNLCALLRDERGAGLLEYIILAGLVAIVAIAGFQTFGSSVNDKAAEQAGAVDSIPGGASSGGGSVPNGQVQ